VSGLGRRLVRLLGIGRRFTVDGVRYTEGGAEPLELALSRKGTGSKQYSVTFTDGSRMQIRATPRREFADLTGPRLLEALRPAMEAVRPGMRALVLRGGTGYVAAWLAGRVGPSGAVVSLEPDEEAARYASKRYRLENTAFEQGWLEALRGEVDGAFDAVFAVEAIWTGDTAAEVLRESWRLVGSDGWLIAGGPRERVGSDDGPLSFTTESLRELILEAVREEASGAGGEDRVALLGGDDGAWVMGAVRREGA
jgi:SAM-dependent methyltransferase